MAYVLDSGDALRIVVMGVAALIGLGASIAWIPAFKFDAMVIPARLLLAVTAIIIAFGNPVTVVLGVALAAVAVMLWWQTQAVPEVPRPHLLGVVMISIATGTVAFAVLVGWSSFGRLPDAGRGIAAVIVASVGALAVLAAADRARVRLRDAIRRRFHPVDVQLVPAAGTDSVFTDGDDQVAPRVSDTLEGDAVRAMPSRADDDVTVERISEPDDEPPEASDESEPPSAETADQTDDSDGRDPDIDDLDIDDSGDDEPTDKQATSNKAAAQNSSDQATDAAASTDESAGQKDAKPTSTAPTSTAPNSAKPEPAAANSAEPNASEPEAAEPKSTGETRPAKKPTQKKAAKKPAAKKNAAKSTKAAANSATSGNGNSDDNSSRSKPSGNGRGESAAKSTSSGGSGESEGTPKDSTSESPKQSNAATGSEETVSPQDTSDSTDSNESADSKSAPARAR